jgi:hypothetical protein
MYLRNPFLGIHAEGFSVTNTNTPVASNEQKPNTPTNPQQNPQQNQSNPQKPADKSSPQQK